LQQIARHAPATSYRLAARIDTYLRCPMAVEVSAVRFIAGRTEACNGEPDSAMAFAVYIRNPLAFHVQDFKVLPSRAGSSGVGVTERHAAELASKKAAAFSYADALAEHLGCAVESQLER
jgi:hypothetical protein